MNKVRYSILAMLLGVFAACSTASVDSASVMTVSSAELEFEQAQPSVRYVNVSAPGVWSVIAPSWVSLNPSSGEAGNTMVEVTAAPNADQPGRQGSIIFKSGHHSSLVSVSQFGDPQMPEKVMLYEFLALADEDTGIYTLEGTVQDIQPAGSFKLSDRTASVSVTGLRGSSGEDLLSQYCISAGDTLVVTGTRKWHGTTVECDGACYVSHRKAVYSGPVGCTIAELSVEKDGANVIVPCTIMAAGSEMAIVSDMTGWTLVECEGVKVPPVGSSVLVTGVKASSPFAKVKASAFEIKGSTSILYPAATKYGDYDIDNYVFRSYDFVSINGVVRSGTVAGTYVLDPGPMAMTKCSLQFAGDLSDVLNATADVSGYVADVRDGIMTIVAVSVVKAVSGGGWKVVSEWPIQSTAVKDYYNSAWKAHSPHYGEMPHDTAGTIYFSHEGSCAAGTTNTNNNKLDVPTASSAFKQHSPRAYGTWEGDYWQFESFTGALAGDRASISFQLAGSASSMGYWVMEYLDGSEWKIASEAKTVMHRGESKTYTHRLDVDKAFVTFAAEVRFLNNVERVTFRLTAVSTFQVDGVTESKTVAEGGDGASGWIMLVRETVDDAPKISIYYK